MGGLETLISTLGLSFASGINLYATILVVGLAHRYGWFPYLPEQLHILGDPLVLGVAGVLYVLEFFADKVPFVSTIWDGFHTFIRPVGGALLALGAADGLDPAGKAVVMLIGGSVALTSHTTKASARVLAHTAPEPATHSAISVAEDVGVVGAIGAGLHLSRSRGGGVVGPVGCDVVCHARYCSECCGSSWSLSPARSARESEQALWMASQGRLGSVRRSWDRMRVSSLLLPAAFQEFRRSPVERWG